MVKMEGFRADRDCRFVQFFDDITTPSRHRMEKQVDHVHGKSGGYERGGKVRCQIYICVVFLPLIKFVSPFFVCFFSVRDELQEDKQPTQNNKQPTQNNSQIRRQEGVAGP